MTPFFSFRTVSTVLLTLLVLMSEAFGKTYLTISSVPSGATVEIDGMIVGKTPYKVEVPGGYIHGTHSVFGKVLRQQMHLRLQLDGYLPVDTDLARGPMPWIALNGTYHGDYWLLKTADFRFELNKAATAFTGNVQMTAAVGSASLVPALPTEDIVRMASPAVLFLKGSDGTGSGFLVTETGVAVTNAHVAEGQSVLAASTPNGQTFNAHVQYIDPDLDLALIKLDGTNFAHIAVADLSTIQSGSTVIAIGNPSQGFQNTVTKGIVSAIGAMSSEPGTWVQTDTAINPGNSGGPLLNSAGEVVGITTQKKFMSRDGRPLQGIGFALSSRDLLNVLRRFYPNMENLAPRTIPSQSGTGTVLIASDSPGADIFVDDNFVGNTPSTLTLAAGPHNVRIESPNHVPWSRQVQLMKDSNINLKATLLAAPANAPPAMLSTAKLSGESPSVSVAPATSPKVNLVNEQQTARATDADRASIGPMSSSSKLASSEPGDTPSPSKTSANWIVAEVNSSAAKPKVSINSFPSGAQVFIDSGGVCKTPCTIEVLPGIHSMQVVLSGYQDRSGKITVNAGVDLTVDINLQDK
jgi:hypothetical protein